MSSGTERFEIAADYTPEQISRAIMFEESMGFVFADSQVATAPDGSQLNEATFSVYLAGDFPPDCRVEFANATVPPGHVKEWSGVMLVAGQPRDVVLYRQQASASKAPSARVLKLESNGAAVRRWQTFLGGQGFDAVVNGVFDRQTHEATEGFQRRHKLFVDGVVGNESYGQAALLGFELVDFAGTAAAGYPPEPGFPPVVGTSRRQALFGKFRYVSAPQPGNPENIDILGTWVQDNIVTIVLPQLNGVGRAPMSGRVQVHRLMAEPIRALWASWDQAGLLPLIQTWDGAFVPRFVRGSRTSLSNHAFGSAFDINADTNPYGVEPAWPGKAGCVFELVPLAHQHGFYWGGHFKGRRDGMHFELAAAQGG